MPKLPDFRAENFDSLPGTARIRINAVAELTSLSKATIWRRVAAGALKAPERDGGATFWRVADVRAYLSGSGNA